ncbi:MAG: hypothetical protein AAGA17_18015 [Actinomycetota bacterium]
MSEQFWWFLARASGIVAWAVLAGAVACGLVLATRLIAGREVRRWLVDMHRFLGGLGLAFTVVHLAALVADNYVHFDLADLLVPMASEWRPVPVALGVVAFWFLVAVELSSLAMRRLPRRVWRTIHFGSYGSFGLATAHGLSAGTDLGSTAAIAATFATVGIIVLLFLVRLLTARRARRRARRRIGVRAVAPTGRGRALTNAR